MAYTEKDPRKDGRRERRPSFDPVNPVYTSTYDTSASGSSSSCSTPSPSSSASSDSSSSSGGCDSGGGF